MKIVRIALENYFFKGIPIADTINNHNNIYDFCLRLRTNKGSSAHFKYINNREVKFHKLTKTTRYYISKSGGILEKNFSDKIVGVNVGYTATLFNNYEEKEMKDYNINYNFYITEARKIIDQIEDKQLTLL